VNDVLEIASTLAGLHTRRRLVERLYKSAEGSVAEEGSAKHHYFQIWDEYSKLIEEFQALLQEETRGVA
jgi:hypothetical protein